jgi:hypothetical protein
MVALPLLLLGTILVSGTKSIAQTSTPTGSRTEDTGSRYTPTVEEAPPERPLQRRYTPELQVDPSATPRITDNDTTPNQP